MTTATRASPSLSSATLPGSMPLEHSLYRVPVGWVKLGMYVAELDRPWLGTPFMMQGFLVSSPRQIEALAQHCQHVVIEADASLPEVVPLVLERGELVVAKPEAKPPEDDSARRIRAPAPGAESRASTRDAARTPAAAQSAVPKPRQIGPVAQVQTSEGALMRFLRWLLRLGRKPAPEVAAPRMPRELEREIRASLPPDAQLQDWPEKRSVQSELPRARAALSLAEQKLTVVFADLNGGKVPAVESVRAAMDHVVASMIDNPNALLWVTHLRQMHARSYQHSLSVALHMVALGRHLGFPRAQLVEIGMVGLLADVGKIRVAPELLERSEALTPDEFDAIKAHVQHGLDLLADAKDVPAEVRNGIAQHHERMDGSGYPAGLVGPEITIYGRIAGIADSFVALTSKRSYADAITPHQALMTLFDGSQGAFHGPLVEQFVRSIGVFPVGSLIELSTGEVAVVLAHNRVRRLEPRVLLLMDPRRSCPTRSNWTS